MYNIYVMYLSSSCLHISYILKVVHGCDPNAWHRGSDGVQLTLLHRAILLHDTATSCFLIRNGADVNSATRPGGSGAGFYPPLHLACERGLVEVVQCLMEHHTNVNATVRQSRAQ